MSSAEVHAGGEDWLAALLGPAAARVLRAYAVRCLHHAHASALYHYRLATWTNNNTYGTDRFHCFCSTFGEAVSSRLPSTTVHRPEDAFGSPFLLDFGAGALYCYRYGNIADDDFEGIPVRSDSWIMDRLVRRAPLAQGVLSYPDLPPIPLSRIVFLAWAGNRTEGLARAFFGRPYLGEDNKLYWLGDIEELDVEAGRNVFGLPPAAEDDFAPRHSLTAGNTEPLPPEPSLDLTLLDEDSGLDLTSLFSEVGFTGENSADETEQAVAETDEEEEDDEPPIAQLEADLVSEDDDDESPTDSTQTSA